jgi:hypothetical protein
MKARTKSEPASMNAFDGGSNFFLTNPITSDAAFYRLNHP